MSDVDPLLHDDDSDPISPEALAKKRAEQMEEEIRAALEIHPLSPEKEALLRATCDQMLEQINRGPFQQGTEWYIYERIGPITANYNSITVPGVVARNVHKDPLSMDLLS